MLSTRRTNFTTRRTNLSSGSTSKLATLNPPLSTLFSQSYSPYANSSMNHATPCAFHPDQKITNFCKNKQCLLPLCPKCIKIHSDEHQSIGVFGDFNSIEEVIEEVRQQINDSFTMIEELSRLTSSLRTLYDNQLSTGNKTISKARESFHLQIDTLFNSYQKEWTSYFKQINENILKDISQSEDIMSFWAEQLQEDDRKLESRFTMMEAIIRFYSSREDWKGVEQKYGGLKLQEIKSVQMQPKEEELNSLTGLVQNYLKLNVEESLLNQINQRSSQKTQPSSLLTSHSIQKNVKKKSSSLTQTQKNEKNINFESELSFARFKSPLDDFNLSKFRELQKQC